MANIEINDIKPAGAELFVDSESFMNDLSDSELNNVGGLAELQDDVAFTNTFAYTCCRTTSNFTDTFAFTCGLSPKPPVLIRV